MLHRQKMAMLTVIAAYTASVFFAAIATALIVYAPESRILAANIGAATLLVLAAGIAGFTRLQARFFGAEVRASRKSN